MCCCCYNVGGCVCLCRCLSGIGDRKQDYKAFVKLLPDTHCRFCLYDHEWRTDDNRLTGRLKFIWWYVAVMFCLFLFKDIILLLSRSPSNTNPTDRVKYSQALKDFKESFHGVDFLAATEEDEITDVLENEV